MYKALLIFRYLRRKLVPMFAALAVTLCTAMVIIVISVMGGWLNMARETTHRLTADLTIRAGLTGFAHYQDLLGSLRAMPEVAAAVPAIEAYGLIKIHGSIAGAQVVGAAPVALNGIVPFRDSLYWTKNSILDSLESAYGPRAKRSAGTQARLEEQEQRLSSVLGLDSGDYRDLAMRLTPPPALNDKAGTIPGIIPGVALAATVGSEGGKYWFSGSSVGQPVTLTVLPLDLEGGLQEPATRRFVDVNEFKSGLYDMDASRVYISFTLLQKMLRMDPHPEYGPDGEPTGQTSPGRTGEVLIRAKPGADLIALRGKVSEAIAAFEAAHPDVEGLRADTWEDQYGTFLNAVEKEKGLLTVLFGIVSVVAVAMITVIFYMIVLEKTRDIGVLRAVGASRGGVMSIFLGYGLAIGLLGAGLGLVLAAAVVWNLNQIQDVLYRLTGFRMWDPAIYYFDKIPDRLNPREVTVILIIAVVGSVLGSLLPAYLAGRQNPVDALRYE